MFRLTSPRRTLCGLTALLTAVASETFIGVGPHEPIATQLSSHQPDVRVLCTTFIADHQTGEPSIVGQGFAPVRPEWFLLGESMLARTR